ncbi:MAG: ATP12 family chaperone protein [Pseudomonadota bacterium]
MAKRFYKNAAAVPQGAGFAMTLDGRPVKTPAKRALVVPSLALAEAMAAEWLAQNETILPASMPLNRLANTAIDRVSAALAETRAEILRFGATDLLCYRADSPDALVKAQAQAWDPLIAWLGNVHGIRLHTAKGVTPIAQPDAAARGLAALLAPCDAFALTGLGSIAAAAGSLIIALAVQAGVLDSEAAWAAASVDEAFQRARWGEDEEHGAMLAARRGDLTAAARFLKLLGEKGGGHDAG